MIWDRETTKPHYRMETLGQDKPVALLEYLNDYFKMSVSKNLNIIN